MMSSKATKREQRRKAREAEARELQRQAVEQHVEAQRVELEGLIETDPEVRRMLEGKA